jgi:hypothetical protein
MTPDFSAWSEEDIRTKIGKRPAECALRGVVAWSASVEMGSAA